MLTLHSLLHDISAPIEPLSDIWNASKVIRSATVVESTETTEWFRGGALLMADQNVLASMGETAEFITDLSERRCAALAIRGTRGSEIIQRILAQANQAQLPLLLIPEGVSFFEVLNPVNREIGNDQRGAYFTQCAMKQLLQAGDARLENVKVLGLDHPDELGLILFRTEFCTDLLMSQDVESETVTLIDRFEDSVTDACEYLKSTGLAADYAVVNELNEISMALFVQFSIDYNQLISSFEKQIDTDGTFHFGVSDIRPLTQAEEAYEQADFAYRNGSLLTGPTPICRYRDVEFYQHINKLSESPETDAFFAHTDVLADHPHLLKTLTTFFAMNEQFKPTSKKLFIHVNTLRYRLEQIKKLTGLDYTVTSEKVWLFLGSLHINEM
ncbi:transcriptional regulator, CdaR [Coriobacterium glomerans PW2]|uniref:Transcriptional regulator, CdaR n=1 Tax=Coriobacterium glomerans (strain ATCC 49209 / DSM 20642 / JCM 10262 / PW2) TaxID=700015 RepID=F2N9N2_CORGP|nr:PucR family transcriptional regulator [Coriobacterium glomerans]AEB07135.1 transcriptional regulator, CdaR [Coriobacterium glomerans PW2]